MPYVDEQGMLIATEDLVVSPPWEVRPSGAHQGRFFFFNTETGAALWSISPVEVGLGGQINEPPMPPPDIPPDAPPPASGLDGPGLPGIPGASSASMTASRNASFVQGMGSPGSSASGASSPNGAVVFENRSHRQHLQIMATASSSSSLSSRGSQVISPRQTFDEPRLESGILDPSELPRGLVVIGGLSQGRQASVVLAKRLSTGDLYALKAVPKSSLTRPRDRERLATELRIMTDTLVSHPPSPFLVQCKAALETPGEVFFLLELVEGGDLFTHLGSRFQSTGWGLEEDDAVVIFSELSCGLFHLHEAGFVHCDIKPENVMLDRWGHVKLADFGLACALEGRSSVQAPSMCALIYAAPEMLRDRVAGKPTDWWAVGVLLHECITGRSPWSTLTDRAVITAEITNGLPVAPPPRVSANAAALMSSLIAPDPSQRLGSHAPHDVRQQPFFAGVDWEATAQQGATPGLVPGALATAPSAERQAERGQSLARYLTSGMRTPGQEEWSLGVTQVETKPPYVPSGALTNRARSNTDNSSNNSSNNST